MTRQDSGQKELHESLSELAERQDMPEDEFADMLENKSAIELMRTLASN